MNGCFVVTSGRCAAAAASRDRLTIYEPRRAALGWNLQTADLIRGFRKWPFRYWTHTSLGLMTLL
jgi:hypothetical protein